MSAKSPAPTTSGLPISWPAVAATLALGALLMFAVGAVLVPIGQFGLHAMYGIVEIGVLNPFGIFPPRAVPFVLANVVLLATAFAAGRRVGGLLAIQSVDRRLRRVKVALGLAAVSGVAGAAGFIATVPWPAARANTTAHYHAGYVLLGYLLYVPVLAVGPVRGVLLYFESHPLCPSCWEWMQRETGGGSFSEGDVPLVRDALASGDLDALGGLPVAEPGGDSYTIRWWECPTCHREAFSTLAHVSDDRIDAPIAAIRLAGHRIKELRELIRVRRELADRARSRQAHHA